jgi:hypothetical protein
VSAGNRRLQEPNAKNRVKTDRGLTCMPDAEDYLGYAAECIGLAQRTSDPEAKARLTQMAQAWRELADRVQSESDGEQE